MAKTATILVDESMEERTSITDEKKSAAFVLGAVAIAAGLVTTTYLLSRRRAPASAVDSTENISDLLGDCRDRIHEIEEQLSRSAKSAVPA